MSFHVQTFITWMMKHSARDSRCRFNLIVVETFSCISLFKVKKLTSEACWEKIRKLADISKMIRLNSWLKIIWFLQWLRDSTVLVSVFVAANFWSFKQMPLGVPGFSLHTDYNQWIGICVSSFYAESWSIFAVPFSTASSWRWTVASG